MEINYEFLVKLINNMGKLLGEKCEIVIHDYSNGFEHTITDIVNGDVTGRKVGGCPSGAFIEKLIDFDEDIEQNPIYFIKQQKNKIIKCCSTLIRDNEGNPVGAVCINLDVSDFILFQSSITNFVNYNPDKAMVDSGEVLVKNVNELMDYYMNMTEKIIGKPMNLMNKEEKIKALSYLDRKGVFKITKANVVLCEAFQISKYTLYSYLEEGRQGGEAY